MKEIFLIILFIVFSTAIFAQVDSTDYTISCIDTDNTGDANSALGQETKAFGGKATAFGYRSEATGLYSIAGGYRAFATQNCAISLGFNSSADGQHSIALGYANTAAGFASFAAGQSAFANGFNSLAIGKHVKSNADGAMTIGMGTGSATNLENIVPNSLLIAFGTTNPTFFVKEATSHYPLGRVGIGTNTPATLLDVNGAIRIRGNSTFGTGPDSKMYVNGDIYANELTVNDDLWPDFVFAPDYNLRKLEEVEEFIAQNGHLPDVPNQAEVLENGHKVAAMDAILLQKIEELTLYIIELNKKIEQLENNQKTIRK